MNKVLQLALAVMGDVGVETEADLVNNIVQDMEPWQLRDFVSRLIAILPPDVSPPRSGEHARKTFTLAEVSGAIASSAKYLRGSKPNSIMAIKTVREELDCPLIDAKDFVDNIRTQFDPLPF